LYLSIIVLVFLKNDGSGLRADKGKEEEADSTFVLSANKDPFLIQKSLGLGVAQSIGNPSYFRPEPSQCQLHSI
jgi:hypothetical protein